MEAALETCCVSVVRKSMKRINDEGVCYFVFVQIDTPLSPRDTNIIRKRDHNAISVCGISVILLLLPDGVATRPPPSIATSILPFLDDDAVVDGRPIVTVLLILSGTVGILAASNNSLPPSFTVDNSEESAKQKDRYDH